MFGYRVILVAVALTLSVNPFEASAQEIEAFSINAFEDKATLSDASGKMGLLQDQTGFTVYPETGIWSVGGTKVAAPYDDDTALLTPGQYIVLCFRPSETMRVRVVNIDVEGLPTQLFPPKLQSVRVQEETTYCLGSPNSALSIKAPATLGDGSLYIIGATSGEPPSPVYMPGLDETIEPKGIAEALYRYRIRASQ